jgi:hypothetical protein
MKIKMVERGGFEPPKAEPADLQSDPFGRSGTSPVSCKRGIMIYRPLTVNRSFFLLSIFTNIQMRTCL